MIGSQPVATSAVGRAPKRKKSHPGPELGVGDTFHPHSRSWWLRRQGFWLGGYATYNIPRQELHYMVVRQFLEMHG
jgi:hypothetical protein